MPFYALKCLTCDKKIEYFGKFEDLDRIRCPKCSEKMVIDYQEQSFNTKENCQPGGGG